MTATVARQTAVPVALALAVVLAFPATSFLTNRRQRIAAAATATLVPLVVFGVVRWIARGFSVADLPPLGELTILSDTPRQLAEHLGLLVLGIAAPLAALAACVGLRSWAAIAPLVLAAAIVAQPVVLTSSWIDANEPRLAGLAVAALVVAAAHLVERFTVGQTVATAICAALFLGSLHHRYSTVDVGRAGWASLVGLAAVVTLVGLGAARLRSGRSGGYGSA